MPTPLDSLTQINVDDLVGAFGFQKQPAGAWLVRTVFQGAAREFAQQMLDFDAAIGSRGLMEASCITEKLFARDVRLFGGERLPDGPALILSNHPGMTDTLALFAALARPDLKVIALDRPFLLSLPNLTSHLDYVTDVSHERAALVRRVVRHLRAGGSVLTFPSGHTEPDPDTYAGAVESLDDWNDSVDVFLKLAPETAVVPVVVRGVTWDKAVHHPLVKTRHTLLDKMLIASALQLLSNIMLKSRPVTIRVQIGKPIRMGDLGLQGVKGLRAALLGSMRELIECEPEGEGISAL